MLNLSLDYLPLKPFSFVTCSSHIFFNSVISDLKAFVSFISYEKSAFDCDSTIAQWRAFIWFNKSSSKLFFYSSAVAAYQAAASRVSCTFYLPKFASSFSSLFLSLIQTSQAHFSSCNFIKRGQCSGCVYLKLIGSLKHSC